MQRDTPAVVGHGEHRIAPLLRQRHIDTAGAAVDHGVFHQVHQHLLDEQRVHGHHHQLMGHRHMYLHVRVVLLRLGHGAADDLLRRLRRLLDPRLLGIVNTRDGQQVLHDADEPLGVLVGGAQQLLPLLLRQLAVLLQQNVGGSHDAGQRGADVVGHRPQQVGVHLLPFRLAADGLRLLGAAGDSRRQHGDGHHHQKRQRKSGQREADVPVGIREYVVHAEHTGHGGDDTQDITVGPVGRQEHVQQEDHRHVAGVPVQVDVPQEQAQQHRRQIQPEGDGQIPSGVGQTQTGRGALPLILAAQPVPIGFLIHRRSLPFICLALLYHTIALRKR